MSGRTHMRFLAAAFAVFLGLALGGCGGGGGDDGNNNAAPAHLIPDVGPAPAAMSAGELEKSVKQLGHPVYWVGPVSGRKYETRVTNDGQFYLRYLPLNAKVDTPKKFRTVGTYPIEDAYKKLTKAIDKGKRMVAVNGPPGSVAGALKNKQENVYLS